MQPLDLDDRAEVGQALRQEPSPEHSWTPVDLVREALAPPEPPTIADHIYPGRRHVFSGETESLKSWDGLVACATEIEKGNTVIWVDLEMGKHAVLERVRNLGLSDDQISTHFIYLVPQEPMTGLTVYADVDELVRYRQPTLVVIDAFTGLLELHGFSPNSGVEVERCYRTIIDRFRTHGAAVVILDHVTKDREGRGRYAIASERKIGACDVHLGFELIRQFGRGRSGLVKIKTHKDRPGHLPRPNAATLELNSDPNTGLITWTLAPAETTTDAQPFRPTYLMERVSRHVEGLPGVPPSRNQVQTDVKGNAAAVRQAIDILLNEGYLTAEPGPRRAQLLRSQRPYREAEDPTSTTSTDFVPTSSETGSSPTSTTSSTPSLDGRSGDGRGQDEHTPLHLVQPDDGIPF